MKCFGVANLSDNFIKEHKLETRVKLEKEIQKAYDKRSSFAHSGIVNKNAKDKSSFIRDEDFHFISFILKSMVIKLVELNFEEKIDHVKRTEAKKNS